MARKSSDLMLKERSKLVEEVYSLKRKLDEAGTEKEDLNQMLHSVASEVNFIERASTCSHAFAIDGNTSVGARSRTANFRDSSSGD